jgi:hypothetical protein
MLGPLRRGRGRNGGDSYVGKKRVADGAMTLGDGWAGCAAHALGQGACVGVSETEVAVTWGRSTWQQGPRR